MGQLKQVPKALQVFRCSGPQFQVFRVRLEIRIQQVVRAQQMVKTQQVFRRQQVSKAPQFFRFSGPQFQVFRVRQDIRIQQVSRSQQMVRIQQGVRVQQVDRVQKMVSAKHVPGRGRSKNPASLRKQVSQAQRVSLGPGEINLQPKQIRRVQSQRPVQARNHPITKSNQQN